MIDDGLPPAEAEDLRRHMGECSDCSEALDLFLILREQIKSLPAQRDPQTELRTLVRIISTVSPRRVPIWSRRLSIPAPALALCAAAFLALAGWSVLLLKARTVRPVPGQTIHRSSQGMESDTLDLSRFDHGQLPLILKVRVDKRDSESNGGAIR